ncbi:MAG: hypothetical protein KGD70_16835 [Candidatus Lokiarchaeota archaeon]|nr:hypothetical protein [Candidatus Lokiarchaeota archaeon]
MVSRVTFSLEKELLDEFRKTCKNNYINQSAIISATMKEIIEKYKKEENK